MAAIGKIRSWGPALVGIIALGLFGFIAGDMFRSCETHANESRQIIGEVLGENVKVQDFQALLDEYQQVIKLTQGRDNLTEEEMNQVKDMVWNSYIANKVMEAQTKKLGLEVTDDEMKSILREGNDPMLKNTPFTNQQTGRFDPTQLTKFLNDYKAAQKSNPQMAEQYKPLYDYWRFIEKQIYEQTLSRKYQALLSNCLISNPISAKAAIVEEAQESDIKLAILPYTNVADKDVPVTDEDLKAKYNEEKEMYKQDIETRDIKFVDFQVVASKSDRDALMKTMKDAAAKLASGANPAEVVRKAQSSVPYIAMPITERALPLDISRKLDSLSVGQTSDPFETTSDNTLNVVKLISKTMLPDSIQYRVIQVGAATSEEAQQRADSIYNAIKGGADFAEVAKVYGQTGEQIWMNSSQYENGQGLDEESTNYLYALNTMAAGETRNINFAQGNIVVQVTDRRSMVEKYDIAVIKHTIDFSKETYSEAYNKFSQFVSESQTLDELEKNASKFGYKVQDRPDLSNSEHTVAGVRATREAMKWVFDAKPGQVSPLYECGNSDHLLVVGLEKIHNVGYRDVDALRERLTQEVIRDKKFEVLKQKLAGVNSIAEAEKKGAQVVDVNQITFKSPVYVQQTGSSEPALSGAVAAAESGKFFPRVVKGNGGAYMFQVVKRQMPENAVKSNAEPMESQLSKKALQAASRYTQELMMKAKVQDKRYLFF
ncbi:MAG: SurA N-terminal domain-containing protein [Prevotella sp.]|nr:SurA N-terminal domain-containing protein [Prevotella sp.]